MTKEAELIYKSYDMPLQEQIRFLYSNKNQISTNVNCLCCGVNTYKQILKQKGKYYSVKLTQHVGKMHKEERLFSTSLAYEPYFDVEEKKRVEHTAYHCTNCQTNYYCYDEFELLLVLHNWRFNFETIIDIKKIISSGLSRDDIQYIINDTKNKVKEFLFSTKSIVDVSMYPHFSLSEEMNHQYENGFESYYNNLIRGLPLKSN